MIFIEFLQTPFGKKASDAHEREGVRHPRVAFGVSSFSLACYLGCLTPEHAARKNNDRHTLQV